VVILIGVLVVGMGRMGHAAKWDPVDPAELAMTTPTVEADADAEVLVWDAKIADVERGGNIETEYEHYLRIKIFTDRGRDTQSRVDIPYLDGVKVRDVEGRTIKKDGSTIELKESDVYEREVLKVSGTKIKATSFVLPGVETGGLVEYRWRAKRSDAWSDNVRLSFSREIPVRLVRYRITPLSLYRLGVTADPMMRSAAFRCRGEARRDGSAYVVSLSNIPSFRDEPRAPSPWDVRPWMLLFYDQRTTASPKIFWTQWSAGIYEAYRKMLSPSSSTQRAARGLAVGGAPVPQAIAAALAYCRRTIARVDIDTTTETARKDFKTHKNPQDALSDGRGTGYDTLGSFVAVMRALGHDARVVFTPRSDDVAFDPTLMLSQLLSGQIAAVRDGEQWRFVDPANIYAPAGELRWQYESQEVLVPDEKASVVVRTPTAAPEWSTRHRTATLALAEDGTLEGDVTAEGTGHLGQISKHADDARAVAERGKALTESITAHLPGAEISAVVIDHVTDPAKPYTCRFHIRVPGFAQRTGSRLFVVPAVFQKGIPAEFTAEKRQSPLFFQFAWRELDEIDIALPPGFVIDGAIQPGTAEVAGVSRYAATVTPSADGTVLKYRRDFVFGADGRLSFRAASYAFFRTYFNDIIKRDGFAVTLKRAQGGA
jgi:hypothetical protein